MCVYSSLASFFQIFLETSNDCNHVTVYRYLMKCNMQVYSFKLVSFCFHSSGITRIEGLKVIIHKNVS